MPLVGTSLNAVTATGPGVAVTFDTPKTEVAMQFSVTGSPSTWEASMEASLDGFNFTMVQSLSQNQGSPAIIKLPSDQSPVLSVRANLVSFSGGSSPTFTAVIAAEED